MQVAVQDRAQVSPLADATKGEIATTRPRADFTKMKINFLDLVIGVSTFLIGLFLLFQYRKEGKSRKWQVVPKAIMIIGAFIATLRLMLSLVAAQ